MLKELPEPQSDYGLELNSLDSEGTYHRYIRSKVQQNENQAILKLEGVQDRSASRYYFGKRGVSVTKSGNSFKTSWGRISRSHGNNGAVLARFSKNLAPRTIGSTLRVMLFPQRHQWSLFK